MFIKEVFIRVNAPFCETGIRVNVRNIESYEQVSESVSESKESIIHLVGRSEIRASHTPDEIDAKIERAYKELE